MKKTYAFIAAMATPLLMMAELQPEQISGQEGVYDENAGTVVITGKLPSTAYDSEYYIYQDLEYISKVVIERHTLGTAWPSDCVIGTLTDQTPGGDFSFTDTEVIPDSKYEYRLTCYLDNVKGYSSYVNVYTGVTPDKPSFFDASTANPEATSVVLTVTAPSTSVSGAPLASLTAIDIEKYENFTYTVLKTIENVEPGQTYTWAHEGLESAKTYYYRARARKGETGWGEAVEAQAYVGLDIPNAPESLSVEPISDTQVLISWNHAADGLRGGSFDPENVVYRVTRRLLDGETIEAGETAPGQTSYTDNHGFTEETWVEYIITPTNDAGIGYNTAETDGMLVGAPAKLPFNESFSYSSFDHKGWTRMSTQDDPCYTYVAWKSLSSSTAYHWATDTYLPIPPQDEDLGLATCLFYSYSPDGQTESLVSPRIALEDASTLELSFFYYDFDAESSGNVVAAFWSGDDGEWNEIFHSEPEEDTIHGWNEVKIVFPVETRTDNVRLRIDAIRGGIPIVDVFVDNIQLKDAGGSSVETIGAAGINSDAAAEYFTIDGRKVQNPESGLYIVRKNGKSQKVLVK